MIKDLHYGQASKFSYKIIFNNIYLITHLDKKVSNDAWRTTISHFWTHPVRLKLFNQNLNTILVWRSKSRAAFIAFTYMLWFYKMIIMFIWAVTPPSHNYNRHDTIARSVHWALPRFVISAGAGGGLANIQFTSNYQCLFIQTTGADHLGLIMWRHR